MAELGKRVREGTVAVEGGRLWYRLVGGGGGRPLLTLHGGPGHPSDYLEPLEDLAVDRPVIFYDQLGCGRSERPDDPGLWRLERFVAEIDAVRRALGLESLHLLGHSWGTMLAVDYALARPPGLASLVLSGPCLSVPRWLADQAAYRRELPAAVRSALERHEATGTTRAPEYQAARLAYNQAHMCRRDPPPAPLARMLEGVGEAVATALWGADDFVVTGSLRDYDRRDRLGELALPTLLTCGRYDGAAPATVADYAARLPAAELVVFERSAHMPHLEETGAYLRTVRDFLRRVDRQLAATGGAEER